MAEGTNKLTVGLQETKEALTFAFAIVNGVRTAKADDGKITVTDVPAFFPALFALKDAVDGVTDIPLEMKNISQEEADELKKWVKDNFDISDDKVEQFIEDGFAIVLDIWMLVKRYVLDNGSDNATTESAAETASEETATPTAESNEGAEVTPAE